MDLSEDIVQELSLEDIQEVLDQILPGENFSFGDCVHSLIQNGTFSFEELFRQLGDSIAGSFSEEKSTILYLGIIAVLGAIFHSFSQLIKEKQVAQTAFFAMYTLFFSVLCASFLQISQLAADTLTKLLDFMKVLVPSFFISLSFTQGTGGAGTYYEFTLVMIALVNWCMVKIAIPGANLYFFLQVSNYLAKEDMFSKMAELLRDGVRLMVKTLFGVMMGMSVIQGLILPITARVKQMAVVQVSSGIPGIGNVLGNTLQTVLCAGTLVKNAVGVTGLVVVALICAVPLLHIVLNRLLYQLVGAAIQPISDRRLVQGIDGTVQAVKLLEMIVGMGAMVFIMSIAIISVMTSIGS